VSKVSVIIPCHNDARYLGEALESVFAQTLQPFEVILVDDGSIDDIENALKPYAARVRLISQPHQGISAARNTGLAAATGEIIAFLDADDLWPQASLAVRLARLDGSPSVDCVFGLVEQFISPDVPHETAVRLNCPAGAQAVRFAGAMALRRSVLDRIGRFNTDLRVGETMDLIARLSEDGAPSANIDALVLRRRIHDQNTVQTERASYGDYLRALKGAIDRRAKAASNGPAQ